MKLQRILLATDFSPPARNATDRAALLAKVSGAEVRIVHVVPERSLLERVMPGSLHAQALMTEGVERTLEALAADVQARIGRQPGLSVKVGAAASTLHLAVREYQPDLLVIGTRGEGAGTFLNALGGTAHKLMLLSEVPLLLVRRPAEDRYRTLLAAVDDSDMAPACSNGHTASRLTRPAVCCTRSRPRSPPGCAGWTWPKPPSMSTRSRRKRPVSARSWSRCRAPGSIRGSALTWCAEIR